jgi:hypothetical protein
LPVSFEAKGTSISRNLCPLATAMSPAAASICTGVHIKQENGSQQKKNLFEPKTLIPAMRQSARKYLRLLTMPQGAAEICRDDHPAIPCMASCTSFHG